MSLFRALTVKQWQNISEGILFTYNKYLIPWRITAAEAVIFIKERMRENKKHNFNCKSHL